MGAQPWLQVPQR